MSRRKRRRAVTGIFLLGGLLLAAGVTTSSLGWPPGIPRWLPNSLTASYPTDTPAVDAPPLALESPPAAEMAASKPAVFRPPVSEQPANAEQPAVNEQPITAAGPRLMNYYVLPGDTLSELADRFEVSVGQLQKYNEGLEPDQLRSGLLIKVPDRTALKGEVGPRFVWPAKGPITTPFGERGNLWIGGVHTGLDVGTAEGDFVWAADKGVIVDTGTDGMGRGFGTYVLIRHSEGLFTLYAHLSKTYREIGYALDRGETIGLAGSTGFADGPHLHFEVWYFGERLDPIQFLP